VTERDLDAVATLGDPARRALYRYVAGQDRPVSRDQAADATGMKRSTAAFHLDRLVCDGLLEAGFARLSGRTGPGAGRTAKLYRRARRQIEVSLPPRRYELAASILAAAVAAAEDPSARLHHALAQAAGQAGHQIAAGASGLAEVLARAGYQPRPGPGGEILLANCPFHDLAARHPRLVCQMNLLLLRGILSELGGGCQARLAPGEGRCCVTITAAGGGEPARASV
jgi:predicted ArsR family transcriptional regulator